MRSLLAFLDARLGEASTWAGVATMLMAAHVNIDPGVWHAITLWGVAAAGVLAVIIRESGTRPAAEMAQDALTALVTAIKAMPDAAPAGDATTKPAQ